MPDFEIHLPAIRGVQAGRAFYLAMCPTRFIPRLIPQDSPGAEESSFKRVADRGRSQGIARYLTGNPESYVLPAITCLIDGPVDFDEAEKKGHPFGLGTLRVPLNSRILILDGINRRSGVEMALKLRPEIGDEAVPDIVLCRFQAEAGRADSVRYTQKWIKIRALAGDSL